MCETCRGDDWVASHLLGEGQGPSTAGLVITIWSYLQFVLPPGLTKFRMPAMGLG